MPRSSVIERPLVRVGCDHVLRRDIHHDRPKADAHNVVDRPEDANQARSLGIRQQPADAENDAALVLTKHLQRVEQQMRIIPKNTRNIAMLFTVSSMVHLLLDVSKMCRQAWTRTVHNCAQSANICGLGRSSASPATETSGGLERLITQRPLDAVKALVGQGGTGTRKLASLKKHFPPY
jgi:hypothetical protein